MASILAHRHPRRRWRRAQGAAYYSKRSPETSDALASGVEAAPWLVGTGEPEGKVPPDELFERLKPFKDRVSDDIRHDEG